MDLITLCIFLVSVLTVFALVAAFFKFGTQEETYEDRIKASRKIADDLMKQKKTKKPKDHAKSKKQQQRIEEEPLEKPKKKKKEVQKPVPKEIPVIEAEPEVIEEPPVEVTDEVDDKSQATPEPIHEIEPEPNVEIVAVQGLHQTAAGKAKAKSKKAKIPIEEVHHESEEEKVPVVEPIIVKEEAVLLYNEKQEVSETQPSTPIGKSKKKKAKDDTSLKKPAAVLGSREVIATVERTCFDEEELQKLIDILLNRQLNSGPSLNGSWVDPAQSELKQLKRQLEETKKAFDDEALKVMDLNKKHRSIRQEQADQISRIRVSYEEQINGLNAANQKVANDFRQLTYEIQNLRHQNDQLVMQSNELQRVYQGRPSIEEVKQEMAAVKQHHAGQVNSMQTELSRKQGLVQELQSQNDAMSKEISGLKELSKSFETKCGALEDNQEKFRQSDGKKYAELQGNIEELLKVRDSHDAKLRDLSAELSARDDKISVLSDDKKQLKAKLSEAEELVATHSKTNGDMHNSDDEEINKLKNEKKVLEEEVKRAKSEAEKLQKQTSVIDSLKSDVEKTKQQLDVANSELEHQRQKNNNDSAELIKERDEVEANYKNFLCRLFPEISIGSESDWKKAVEDHLSTFKSSNNTEDFIVKNEALERQIIHYQQSLKEAETMLNKLRASVESEEDSWKEKLNAKQEELDALTSQKSSLNECVQSAEEMQQKLQELHTKLAEEEGAKEELKKVLANQSNESAKVQQMTEEVESLKKGNTELGLKVARMNELVNAGQEALQQEQKTVELLRDQLAKAGNVEEKSSLNNDVST